MTEQFDAIPLLSIPFRKWNNMQYIINNAVIKSRSEHDFAVSHCNQEKINIEGGFSHFFTFAGSEDDFC